MNEVHRVQEIATRARAETIQVGHDAGPQGAHFGPALSLIEVMATLYGAVLRVDPQNPYDPNRDRMILSKGHGSLALYTVLHQVGFITDEVMSTCETDGSSLPGQPIKNLEMGIEFSSGSLGLGLAYGVGLALSARLSKRDTRVFVVMGDGETNEGSVWEAAMMAAHENLNQLVAVVDVNDLQSDGSTVEVMEMDHQALWKAVGWEVVVVDGHDIEALISAFAISPSTKPLAILAQTVKGKGVDFMEANPDWHHGRMSPDQLNAALLQVTESDKL